MKKIKALIFDLDGTLVSTKEIHYLALAKALKIIKFNLSQTYHDDFLQALPTSDKLEILSKKEPLILKFKDQILQDKQQQTIKLLISEIKEENHLKPLLQILQKQYKLALCSNAQRDTVDLILKRLDITHYFDCILARNDVSEGKPSPEIYQKACEILRISPKESIVFEDSTRGIESAKKAGCFVSAVKSPNDINLFFIQDQIKVIDE